LKLKKLIRELEAIRGRHTELVSVYVPAGYSISEIINQIFQEKGTASNIKSKATRKNVMDALEKIIQHLKLFKQTPPNGLVVFCGNVSPVEGKDDIKLWTFEPPVKMNQKMYWCDQAFVIDPLKGLIAEKEVYGLIVLDAKEASIGILKGKVVERLKHMDSTVPSKSVKGGMCVAPNTLVSLDSGKNVPIEKLKRGQKMLCYDFKNSFLTLGICSDIMKRYIKNAYEICLENIKIVVSPEHLFFVKENEQIKEKFAEDLKIGDLVFFVLDGKCKLQNIKEKNKITSNNSFYDVSVANYENFVANGIVVHNSQRRYDRIIEDALNEFFTKVAEVASQLLLQQPELKGVIIGGPGPTKESFARGNYLHYELQKKLLGVKSTGYTDEYGLQELVERSDDLMKEAAVVKEREIMQQFYSGLQKDGNVVYGYHETVKALEMGAVETLLISEGFEWVHAKLRCECGNEVEKDLSKRIVENQVCPKCKKKMKVEDVKELVDAVTDKAKNLGTAVEFVSVNTREGLQFKELGGIGAFLRYKLNQ
jgi:peptide subunit release factor 1 (eRF1)